MELKQKRDMGWIKIAWPSSLIIIGLAMIIIFFTAPGNPSGIIFVAAIILMAVGSIFLKRNWSRVGYDESKVINVRQKIDNSPKNCMNIYPDKIVFENMPDKSLEGQPWKCENDGRSYYVHIWNEEDKRLREFKLPDQAYMDPQVFAERPLELPAHRRIFRQKQTLLQQLSPIMVLGAIVIVWILIITTT